MTSNLLDTYTRYPVTLATGQGSRLTDVNGRTYLDWLAGISVSVLGHSHPELTAVIARQASRLLHVSNLFTTVEGLAAADRIVDHVGEGKVFFCNSGAEAVEATIKLARKHAWRQGRANQTQIITLTGSFHGRTMGALSATQQPSKWEGFAPLVGGFVGVAPNDITALEAAFGPDTAAIIMEPILGEGGVIELHADFASRAAELCQEFDALLICDEVQTGMGRTGSWWGFEHLGLQPDAIALAKGLAGGLPAGAMWVAEKHADVLRPGDHASTFGGGPLVCAAISCVFDTIDKDGLVDRAVKLGAQISAGLHDVADIRGRGLLLAVELNSDRATSVAASCLEKGLIVNALTKSAVRIAPPLVLTDAEADEGVKILRSAIAEVSA